MPSLLTQSQKDSLATVISYIADTWERPIVIYKEAALVIISTDPNFNRFQQNIQDNDAPDRIPQRFEVPARIWYQKQQGFPYLFPYVGGALDETQMKNNIPNGEVRIKLKVADYDRFFLDIKQVEFDGYKFTLDSTERPHGLFNKEYVTFWLKRAI